MNGQLRLGEETRGPLQIKSCGFIQPDPGTGAPECEVRLRRVPPVLRALGYHTPPPISPWQGCPALGRETLVARIKLLQDHRAVENRLLLLLSHISRVRLCDPVDGSPPGSPVPGILQARTLEWVAVSFSNA